MLDAAVTLLVAVIAARLIESGSGALTPALAAVLLVPAAMRGVRWAPLAGTLALVTWVIGRGAYNWDWPMLSHFGASTHVAAVATVGWFAPWLVALYLRARLAPDGFAAAALAVCAIAVVAGVVVEYPADVVHKLIVALGAIGAARLSWRFVSLRDGEPGALSFGAGAAVVAVAALQQTYWALLGDRYSDDVTVLFLLAWAGVAAAATASVVTVTCARRAGLGALGVVLSAAACAPALVMPVLIVQRAFADFGGSLPVPLQMAIDFGNYWAGHGGGCLWLFAATSLPLSLLALARLKRAWSTSTAVALALHAARMAVGAIGVLPHRSDGTFAVGSALFAAAMLVPVLAQVTRRSVSPTTHSA